jgi:hypothetical protein
MHLTANTLVAAALISVSAMGQAGVLPAASSGTVAGSASKNATAAPDTGAGKGNARLGKTADSVTGQNDVKSSLVADTGTVRKSGALSPAPGQVSDSVKAFLRKASYDSLERIRSNQFQQYMTFPASIDSVFSSGTLRRYRSQNSNATGASELFREMPQAVAVPVALSSSQSRYMLDGFPLLTNAIYSDGNAFGDCPDAVHGTDGLFATQIDDATLASPLGIQCAVHPYGLVAPHTDVLWENGVFVENLLGVRFLRPLTKTIDVGVYSNFRSLAPFNYTTANDIKSFYNYSFSDTTLLANGGRNPLSYDNQTTFSLTSHMSKATSAALSYTYTDSKNDQAVQQYDSAAQSESLYWRTLSRYANVFQTEVRGLPASIASVNIDARADIEGHRLYTPYAGSALVNETMGRNTDLSLGIEPYLAFDAFGADTLSVIGRAERKDQRLYDDAEPAATIGDVRLGLRHGGMLGPFHASVALTGGDGAVKPAGKPLHGDMVYSASGVVSIGMQRLHLFLMQDHLPFVLPYDSLAVPLASYFDVYQAYGADVFFGYKKVGVAAGICSVSGTDTSIAGRFWSDGVMPYKQPSYSLMVTPMVGRVLGFALSSRMMLSDRRPYVKSQSTLGYEADPIFGKEHITADLVYDYWSGRDTLDYAGITIWNREICNLSLVTAVHMQGFCLFYKIDNILNRKFAYVPGYFMPGITFRWGFQWLIPG